MAGSGKALSSDLLGQAVGMLGVEKLLTVSEGESDGKKRWLLSPMQKSALSGEFIVTLEAGQPVVQGGGPEEAPQVNAALRMLIADLRDTGTIQEPTKRPETARSPQGRHMVPSGQRNGQDQSLMKTVNQLTVKDVRDHFCTGATEQEAYTFLQTCLMAGANPWLSEAYLIKYDEKSAARTVMGKYFFLKKAEMHPKYGGFSSGIIVETPDGKIVEKVGKFKLQDEKLLGAWAEVIRTDRNVPLKVTVPLSEYDKGNNQWRKMPATMIEKVAIVQAHRDAFPTDLGGLYDAAEVIDAECEVIE